MVTFPMILLVTILAALGWQTLIDRRDYAAFRMIEDSAQRRRFYRKWTATSFVMFGLGGLVLLLVLGRSGALITFPSELVALRPDMVAVPDISTAKRDTFLGLIVGAALGGGLLFFIWLRRLRAMTRLVIGDVEPLMPRNARELVAAIPLAINAGVSEELFFRLALPLLAAQATGSALAGFLIAGAAFGLVHWYQGWKGALVVTLMGSFFTWLYLSSGSLLKPIAVHAAIDFIGLVIRPAIGLRLAKSRDDKLTAAS